MAKRIKPGQYFVTIQSDGTATWPPELTPWLENFKPHNRPSNPELMELFLAHRDTVFNSSATEEEKNKMWTSFLNVYTGGKR